MTPVSIRNNCIVILLIIAICAGCGCTFQGREPKKDVTFNCFWLLSDVDLRRYEKLAKNGNGEAAYRVWEHYELGCVDEKDSVAIGEMYFNLSVALKYPPALYTKGVRVWNNGKGDPALALKYIEEAKRGGVNYDFVDRLINRIKQSMIKEPTGQP